VREVLQNLDFRSLVRQLPEAMSVVGADIPPEATDAVSLDFGKNVFITKPEDLKKLPLNKANELFLHSRSKGKHGREPQALILSIDGAEVFTLDLQKLSHKAVKDALQTVIEDEKIPKIGYDLKTTIKALYTLGMDLKGIGHDSMIGAFLLNALRREQTLTELAQSDLGYNGSSLEDLPVDELMQRASEFITIIHALYQQQSKALEAMPKVKELAQTIEWPVIPVLAAMEYEGIELDTDYLEKMNVEVSDMISDLEQQIYGHADQEFNIGSPSQLAEILFEKLQLPQKGIKKGKTGFSTAASELDKLRGIHPIIDLITHYREVTKLKNTYIDTLPKMVDENSRLHTTFALTVAQTGRLSSNDPNLQNIPVRTDLGKRIRTAFVAGKGKVLVSADYSQFELRLAAYLANDTELVEMFNNGADIHTTTAAQVYGRNPEEVTKQMRRDAKVINFGVLYGMSPHGLSIATGMTVVAAKTFIDKYFELRKPLLDYMNYLKEAARKQGYVETLFGRRRPMPDIHSGNFIIRQAAERAAINMPIQGTEADLMKLAMIEVQEKLIGTDCKQLLQIHDSILIECPEAEADRVAELLKSTMENVYKLPVKLDVDVSVGKNWGEL
jgi:DNA polymerase-1